MHRKLYIYKTYLERGRGTHTSAHYCFIVIKPLYLICKRTLSITTFSWKHSWQLSQPSQNVTKPNSSSFLAKAYTSVSVLTHCKLWLCQPQHCSTLLKCLCRSQGKEKTGSFYPPLSMWVFRGGNSQIVPTCRGVMVLLVTL